MTRDQYLSRQEAAVQLGLSLREVDHLIACGLLARYRIRERYVRVLSREVEELAQLPRDWLRNA